MQSGHVITICLWWGINVEVLPYPTAILIANCYHVDLHGEHAFINERYTQEDCVMYLNKPRPFSNNTVHLEDIFQLIACGDAGGRWY